MRSFEAFSSPKGFGEFKKWMDSPSHLCLATHVLCEALVEGPGRRSLIRVQALAPGLSLSRSVKQIEVSIHVCSVIGLGPRGW